MIEKAGIWQSEGSLVFKLRSTGVTKKNGQFVEQFENEFSFRVDYNPEDKNMTQAERDFITSGAAAKVAERLNLTVIGS